MKRWPVWLAERPSIVGFPPNFRVPMDFLSIPSGRSRQGNEGLWPGEGGLEQDNFKRIYQHFYYRNWRINPFNFLKKKPKNNVPVRKLFPKAFQPCSVERIERTVRGFGGS